MKSAMQRTLRGFTLTELLVVIAIIVLLAAILFPVFARVREKARASVCASNMKQIGLGLLQYAQDYDETLPTMSNVNNVPNYATSTDTNWIVGVYPYVRSWQIFRCPSAPAYTDIRPVGYDAYKPSGNSTTGYIVNGVVLQRKLPALVSPAALIWAREYYLTNFAEVRPTVSTGSISLPLIPGSGGPDMVDWLNNWSPGTYEAIHLGGMNLLHCDGHVRWRHRNSISSREFGLNGDLKGVQLTGTNPLKIDAAQIK